MGRRKPRIKLRSIYVWHRYIGVGAAALAIILSITGIMLNHTDRLQLDSQYIESNWLLDWYGIHNASNIVNFTVGNQQVSHTGDYLFIDGERIDGHYTQPVGAITSMDILVVALTDQVLLLAPDGELIDRIKTPDDVTRLGKDEIGFPVIATRTQLYRANDSMTAWKSTHTNSILAWATTTPTPKTIENAVNQFQRNHVLDLETVILDLHSGRILGDWGIVIMDTAALLLIFLSLTGFFLWFNQNSKRRQRKRVKLKHKPDS